MHYEVDHSYRVPCIARCILTAWSTPRSPAPRPYARFSSPTTPCTGPPAAAQRREEKRRGKERKGEKDVQSVNASESIRVPSTSAHLSLLALSLSFYSPCSLLVLSSICTCRTSFAGKVYLWLFDSFPCSALSSVYPPHDSASSPVFIITQQSPFKSSVSICSAKREGGNEVSTV